MVTVEEMRRNINAVKGKIAAAAVSAGRKPEDITLIGVSKFQPAESILTAFECGLDTFGENRVQERESKSLSLESIRAEWHMIGSLQRNKARKAINLFNCIQSVDNIELAAALERVIAENPGEPRFAARYPIMIEVNISGEDTKQGVEPEKCFALIDNIAVKCPHVEINGLMSIGPLTEDETKIGESFATLRRIREEAKKRFDFPMNHLSMGMSGDYELAIKEGSTMVRIGTSIFGPRNHQFSK